MVAKQLLIFILFMWSASSARSQTLSDNFNLKLGYGLANFHNEAIWTNSDESAKDGQLALASIGYTKKFENFNLTSELFTFIGSNISGSYSTNNTVYRTKNIWGISLNPEFKLYEESFGYVKVGYALAESQESDNYGSVNYGFSKGWLYGFGMKLPLKKDIFLGLETFRINFSRTNPVYSTGWSTYTTNKPNITFSSIYIGINF